MPLRGERPRLGRRRHRSGRNADGRVRRHGAVGARFPPKAGSIHTLPIVVLRRVPARSSRDRGGLQDQARVEDPGWRPGTGAVGHGRVSRSARGVLSLERPIESGGRGCDCKAPSGSPSHDSRVEPPRGARGSPCSLFRGAGSGPPSRPPAQGGKARLENAARASRRARGFSAAAASRAPRKEPTLLRGASSFRCAARTHRARGTACPPAGSLRSGPRR